MSTNQILMRCITFLEGISEFYRNMEHFPVVTAPLGDKQQRHDRLLKATRIFVENREFEQAIKTAGVSERQFFLLLKKAFAPMKGANEINGSRAFVSFMVQKPRNRRAPLKAGQGGGGLTGAFGKTLHDYPRVEARLRAWIEGDERPNKITPHLLLEQFKIICRSEGVSENEYPLSAARKGAAPLQRWFTETYPQGRLIEEIKRQMGVDAATAAKYELGTGKAKVTPIHYLVWVIDEHTVDLNCVVELPNPRWGVDYLPVSRFQVILCRSIGAIACNVSFLLSLQKQATGPDIITVFRNAVLGQPPAPVVDPSMKLEEGAGFPANVFKKLLFALPILVYLDNALAHLFNPLQSVIQRLFGGRVVLGVPGEAKGRPDIESAFAHLVSGLIHHLPATTGSGPLDPLREGTSVQPPKRVPVGLLEQATYVYFANQNVLPSAGAGHLSAFTRLARLLDSEMIKPNYLVAEKRAKHHFSEPKTVHIVSDLENGRLPHVWYLYKRYSSEWLKQQIGLERKNVRALTDYDDLRTIVLVDESGASWCTLTCEGPWARIPHDLRVVQICGRYKNEAAYKSRPGDHPLLCTLKFLASEARSKPTAALDLAYLMKYLEGHLSPEAIAHVTDPDVLDITAIEIPDADPGGAVPLLDVASGPTPPLTSTGQPSSSVLPHASEANAPLVPHRFRIPRRF